MDFVGRFCSYSTPGQINVVKQFFGVLICEKQIENRLMWWSMMKVNKISRRVEQINITPLCLLLNNCLVCCFC